LNLFIKDSAIKNPDKMLNVACGYGPETFIFYEKFKPNLIEGLDITKIHIDYANHKAKLLNLNNKIKFCHGDACDLNFPENTFSHILGIEGIAHFNTREKFFKEAHRVLKKDGEMILSDLILGKKFKKKSFFSNLFVSLATKAWVGTKENCVNEKEYRKQLENIGFEIVFLKKIGNKIYPGYGHHFSKIKTIKEEIKERGFLPAIGLSIISMLLGFLYKKGWIEYIYVKAKKI